jgi:hypothetical protein
MSLYTRVKDLGAFGLTNAVKLLILSYPSGSITLVNASQQNDGYGAQIQRILSVKALADSLKIEFRFEPLKQVERQLTQDLLQDSAQNLELAKFNKFLTSLLVSSSNEKDPNVSSYFSKTLIQIFLTLLRNFLPSALLKRKFEIRLEDTYRFVQFHSNLYSKLECNFKAIEQIDTDNIIRIGVHLRFVNFAVNTERYLDPDYYFRSLDQITQNLEHLGIPYTIRLHSDFKESLPEPSKTGISGSTFEYLTEIGVTDQDGQVDSDTFKRANQCRNRIISRYGVVIESETEDPLVSLKAMANSNYLILSKSSFAFVGGILNKKGRVISPEYWNRPLASWNKNPSQN